MFRNNNKWLIFLIVATGVFMSTLDSSMVNIALPTIMEEFNSSLRNTEWVVMIYLLTITSSLLFWGHLSDRFGRGKIYPAGMLTFNFLAIRWRPLPNRYSTDRLHPPAKSISTQDASPIAGFSRYTTFE